MNILKIKINRILLFFIQPEKPFKVLPCHKKCDEKSNPGDIPCPMDVD